MTVTISPAPARRYDLDWLRIIAFGLLILYHTGMFYVTWDFHVKSDHASKLIEPLMLIVNPWRLDLLFLISGVATRYLADKTSALGLAGSRFHRLFWPLAFSILVIVPPQSYYEIVQKIHYAGGPLDFYGKYITGYHGWCRNGDCLIVPTWNHMWFVAYLLDYTLILALLWPLLRGALTRFTWSPPAWMLLILPWLCLWAIDQTLEPRFKITHALVDDWYAHANYGLIFLLGVGFGKTEGVFEAARRARFLSLGLAVAAYAARMVGRFGHVYDPLPELQHNLVVYGLYDGQAWFAIIALLGFARQHLSTHDGPIRRTLTEAIFPFYIIHQTIIVVAGYQLNLLHLPVAFEASILIALTVLGCAATYVVAKRVKIFRPLFGLSLKT